MSVYSCYILLVITSETHEIKKTYPEFSNSLQFKTEKNEKKKEMVI